MARLPPLHHNRPGIARGGCLSLFDNMWVFCPLEVRAPEASSSLGCSFRPCFNLWRPGVSVRNRPRPTPLHYLWRGVADWPGRSSKSIALASPQPRRSQGQPPRLCALTCSVSLIVMLLPRSQRYVKQGITMGKK